MIPGSRSEDRRSPLPERGSAILSLLYLEPLLRPENTDHTLGINDGVRQHPAVGLFEWDRMNLQKFGIIVASIPTGCEPLGQKQSDRPCGEPDRGIEGAQPEQPARSQPDLFLALAPR